MFKRMRKYIYAFWLYWWLSDVVPEEKARDIVTKIFK